jgi:UDP-N-acetylmuramoyl-tripeptide--D-alanyl-D-alanine ligase
MLSDIQIFMILKISSAKLFELVKGKKLNNIEVSQNEFSISTDTRQLKRGEIFIALKGPNFNGNTFLKQAVELGASIIIIDEVDVDTENFIPNKTQSLIILVDNGIKAYGKLANYYRNNQLGNCKIIGITGSVGKTITKNLLGFVVDKLLPPSFLSEANLNNQIGIPKNLFQIPENSKAAMLEMGMRGPGEIDYLSSVAEPDLVIITNVSAAHLEFFQSVEDIAKAKAEIFNHLKKDGWVILNKNNDYFDILHNLALEKTNKIISYSIDKNKDAEIVLVEQIINEDNSAKVTIKVNKPNEVITYNLPLATRSLIENSLAIFAVALIFSLDLEKVANTLSAFPIDNLAGRGKILTVKLGIKNLTIIDDSYNAAPEAMKAALDHLSNSPFKNYQIKRRVAFIGEMRELGQASTSLHLALLNHIDRIDKIITIGSIESLNLSRNIPEEKNLGHFENVEILLSELDGLLEDNDLILLKGAKSIKLRRVLEYLGCDLSILNF